VRAPSTLPVWFSRASQRFGRAVHAIRDEQWGLPTPCTDWNVRDLVHHLVYENVWAPPLFEGRTLEEVGDRFEGDLLGDDPKGAWDRAARAAVEAVERPGALERTVNLSYGDVRGEHYAFELFTDMLIHAWDLSRAIGTDETLDEDLVRVVYERMKPREAELKASGLFGERLEPPAGVAPQTAAPLPFVGGLGDAS
jgi:uncharacterized protein (TIGR03086 family)